MSNCTLTHQFTSAPHRILILNKVVVILNAKEIRKFLMHVSAFTFEFFKKYQFYILKGYFIYFINLLNNTSNISFLIFTNNTIK